MMDNDDATILVAGGIAAETAADWLAAEQTRTADLSTDRHRYATFWQKSADIVAGLAPKPRRSGDAFSTA